MCGVLGIYDEQDQQVIGKFYNAMLTIQHRGQDFAGILTYDGNQYHIKKGSGLVQDIFRQENINRLRGYAAIGHTRYPTVGMGTIEDAQPFWVNNPYGVAIAHNGNLSNFHDLKEELAATSHVLTNSNCDVEVLLHLFADYLQKNKKRGFSPELIFNAIQYIYKHAKGSYSVVIHIAGHGMVGFRDPYGIRPLLFGQDLERRSFGFASESVAMEVMGFRHYRDLEPGSAVFIDADRRVHERKLSNKPFRPCIFEYIYFARPDSCMNGINVYKAREELGKRLAAKIRAMNLDIDVVVPVPDSARTAAIKIARDLKLNYHEGLVKNRYIGRTFIMPGDQERKRSISHKLHPIRDVFQGARVLLVDDSIVRGNTSRSIVQMVREAGAAKVYFASYSSPLLKPCVYGIDMQTKGEFIAKTGIPDEYPLIASQIGADLVIYQDLKEMERAVKKENSRIKTFCMACFTGHYPTGDVTPGILEKLEQDRLDCHNPDNQK